MVATLKVIAGLVIVCAYTLAQAAAADIGAVVVHGKWGSPTGPTAPLVSALEREGFSVSAPEMPWSGRRLYDESVDHADAQIDAEIAKLRERGAKHIFFIGHSLGVAFALHYAGRAALAGIAAIAPGHRIEAGRFAQSFAHDVENARELVAAGKPDEHVGFTDLNTGGRRSYLRVSAVSFLSYFDPAGPLNMTRNAESLGTDVPVLWLVPVHEEEPLRSGIVALFPTLQKNSGTRFVEPDSDHLAAPAASAQIIAQWMREIAGKN